MSSRAWPAPAKINLFLRVLRRRPDGFHDLQTVFQFLDLCDELTFTPTRNGRVRRVESDLDWPEDCDLAVRAARLLRAAAGTPAGADIAIRKRIPAGSGLGGGSSDAATTLVALDRIWGLGLGVERLAGLGRRLGADVPVFVRGRAAWAEGTGDRLRPLRLDEPRYVLLVPPCRVSTAAVFASLSLTRDRAPLKIDDFLFGGRPPGNGAPPVTTLLEDGVNDCEVITRKRYPPVDEAFERLARFGRPRMTGTGGAVFLPLAGDSEGGEMVAHLPAGWRGYVCRGLNRSPLLARAERG